MHAGAWGRVGIISHGKYSSAPKNSLASFIYTHVHTDMTAADVKSVMKAVAGVANGAGSVKKAVPVPEEVEVFPGS